MTPKDYTEYLNKKIIALVARRAGTSSSYVYRIGRGTNGCSVEMAVALEEASKHYAKRGNDFMTVEEILNIEELRKARTEEMEQRVQTEKVE